LAIFLPAGIIKVVNEKELKRILVETCRIRTKQNNMYFSSYI